jgi:hypothetical protein
MYPNHMPLVVLAKGEVIYKKGDMPHIGCRASENLITQANNRLIATHMLSKSMSLIQRSLLKGK